ncbi:MAG: tetratricopeptide repeat protein [Candidatus Accumulibacter sp.]|jgi:FimV-like protein|nr:tetratricopeptide repeat protein [Accumulibacter sp.]
MSLPDSQNTQELLKRMGKGLERLRVLIVDRHSGARTSLRILLSTLGITSIHNATSSAEVLRNVKSYDFHVILADYVLEDERDGQQLLEELRQQHLISLSTVYMLITAERAYQNVVSVAELTPDDYLIKPFTADMLEGRLVRALYKKKFFEPIFRPLDDGALVDALAACEMLLARDEPQFLADTLRHKGSILNTLGRYGEAKAVYERVLDLDTAPPWARMGLAVALRGLGDLAEAENIGSELIHEFPEYLAAYDFVANVCEERGDLTKAQEMLQKATVMSPNNSLRQRTVGDVAVRNKDLEVAERAYGKVLERRRGSSLRVVDDYANLTRVLLDRGRTDGARRVTQELRRDWRGNSQGEFAALVMDSLCSNQEGESEKARQSLEKALSLHDAMQEDAASGALSQKITVDLAHACLATGDEDRAREILGKVAAENHEDRDVIAQIQNIFAKTGKEEAGQDLLAEVGREIVELNNRGAVAAESGDDGASVQTLIEAAERVPSLQFLTDASKAIFTLLDHRGWNEEMAERGLRYLRLAQAKDMNSPKVVSARELYFGVARKYGIEAAPLVRGLKAGEVGI